MLKTLKRSWFYWLKWAMALTIPILMTSLLLASSFGGVVVITPVAHHMLITIRGRLLFIDKDFQDDFGIDFGDFGGPAPPPPPLFPPLKTTWFIPIHPPITGDLPPIALLYTTGWDSFQQSLLVRASMVSKGPVSFRIWPILLISLLWPAFMIFRAFQSFLARRRKTDKDSIPCHSCGYDLRATPSQCPECGNIPASKTTTTPTAPSF